MEHEQDRAEYRARLLEGLTVSARRSACRASDPIQVFLNERRVGWLDGGGAEATFQIQSPERIDTVHLRSEDGVLLGGLSAPESGFRTGRIARGRDTIELRVHNNAQGGSLTAVFMPAPSRWRQAWQAVAGVATAARRPAAAIVPGMRAVAFTQVVLALVVAGLAADRTTGWMTAERTPLFVTPADAPWAAPLADVAKLERQLDMLAQMQVKAVETIQTQQQGMTQLQQAMAKLSATQEAVASGVLTVRREVEKRQKGPGREVERLTRMFMSKAHTEQEELEAEIHSLTVANDKLSKELSLLEQSNQDLKKKLKSAGLDVSKASTTEREKPAVALQIDAAQPPQVAESRPAAQVQPFLFWVSFSEGTSQESIDQWVNEMHGDKKSMSEGWQEVEVVPPAVPADRFLEQIQQTKFVKAVRVSR
jgi:hypothetical protein